MKTYEQIKATYAEERDGANAAVYERHLEFLHELYMNGFNVRGHHGFDVRTMNDFDTDKGIRLAVFDYSNSKDGYTTRVNEIILVLKCKEREELNK